MGYRPRSSPKYIDREDELRELQQERANYVFLRNEMNPIPGGPVDVSFRDAIADVDARIAEIAPSPTPPAGPGGVAPARLPRVNPRTLEKGYLA